MKYLIFVLAVVCLPAIAFCQDITGLWKGTLFNDSTGQTLQYEVFISKESGRYTGFSHTWFLINDIKYYGIKKIKVRIANDGKIILQDAALVENNYPPLTEKNVYQLNVLNLANVNNHPVLDGPFVTSPTKEYRQLTGHINLKKLNLLSESDLGQYLQRKGLSNTLAIVK